MRGMPQLTQQQQAAIQAINEANAPLAQAVTEARNALNAAIYTDKPDTADIKAKAEKLAAAELALAQARAEAFARLQASPNKLNLPPQQISCCSGVQAGDLAVQAASVEVQVGRLPVHRPVGRSVAPAVLPAVLVARVAQVAPAAAPAVLVVRAARPAKPLSSLKTARRKSARNIRQDGTRLPSNPTSTGSPSTVWTSPAATTRLML